MPREGRPFWWPRCGSCGHWLSWERMGQHALDERWRCLRCLRAAADAYEREREKEDTHA